MGSFEEAVQFRAQEITDKAVSAVEKQRRIKAFHVEFMKVINAYNHDGVEIGSAPFLADDAKVALRGLVRTYTTHGINPKYILRGHTKGFLGIRSGVNGYGWQVKRHVYQDLTHLMIVTPDNLVMSSNLPPLPGDSVYRNDSVRDPGQLENGHQLKDYYRGVFVTSEIVGDVVDQIALSGLQWVDP